MKVVLPTHAKKPNKTGFPAPPIPLERPDPKELGKSSYIELKLRSVPENVDSALYTLTVPYFRSGTSEEWFLFTKSLFRVIEGQQLTTGPSRYSMARRLLQGDPLLSQRFLVLNVA